MSKADHKNFNSPEEVRRFEKGKLELITVGWGIIGRFTLEPGWRWSLHTKPIAKTPFCETRHFAYHLSGHLHVRMEDGTEFEVRPGEVAWVPSGHDAWVVGNEPAVILDVTGMKEYAKVLK
jgi:quercetin dioxygenase-like cupin family protein